MMLTLKQAQLLRFIDAQVKAAGVCPSFDEMATELSLASKGGVHRLISALEERGYIRRLHKRARAVEILRMPGEPAPAPPIASPKISGVLLCPHCGEVLTLELHAPAKSDLAA